MAFLICGMLNQLRQLFYCTLYELYNQFPMLKFLDNRTHQKQKKSPIKFKPEMVYGISAEAPTEFQTPYTIVHSQTYINPYLNFDKNRQSKLPEQKIGQIKPEWTKKINLQMVEEQKIITSTNEKPLDNLFSRYRKSYKNELEMYENRFKITRGQFSDFIEKNNRYKSMGPIHGKERTSDRIQSTKKSVWLKPDSSSSFNGNKMLYSTYFDMMRQSSCQEGSLFRNQSSISNNSKLISQKSRIRDNRQKMNASFQRNLEQRKQSLHFKVELPKLHSEIIRRPNFQKIKPLYQQIDGGIEGIEEFQKRLHRQFK